MNEGDGTCGEASSPKFTFDLTEIMRKTFISQMKSIDPYVHLAVIFSRNPILTRMLQCHSEIVKLPNEDSINTPFTDVNIKKMEVVPLHATLYTPKINLKMIK